MSQNKVAAEIDRVINQRWISQDVRDVLRDARRELERLHALAAGNLEPGPVYAESAPVDLDGPAGLDVFIPLECSQPQTWDLIFNPHGSRRVNVIFSRACLLRIEPGQFEIFEAERGYELQSEDGQPTNALQYRGLSYAAALSTATILSRSVPANLLENGEPDDGNASPTATSKPADSRP